MICALDFSFWTLDFCFDYSLYIVREVKTAATPVWVQWAHRHYRLHLILYRLARSRNCSQSWYFVRDDLLFSNRIDALFFSKLRNHEWFACATFPVCSELRMEQFEFLIIALAYNHGPCVATAWDTVLHQSECHTWILFGDTIVLFQHWAQSNEMISSPLGESGLWVGIHGVL